MQQLSISSYAGGSALAQRVLNCSNSISCYHESSITLISMVRTKKLPNRGKRHSSFQGEGGIWEKTNPIYRRKTIPWLFWLLTPVFSCFVVPVPGMGVSAIITQNVDGLYQLAGNTAYRKYQRLYYQGQCR